MKGQYRVFWPGLGAMLIAVIATAWISANGRRLAEMTIDRSEIVLPADGVSTETIRTNAKTVTARIVDGERRVRTIQVRPDGQDSLVLIRASILPGDATIELRAEGFKPKRIPVRLQPHDADSFEDGTPDYLRLDGKDAAAFRQWFALLAETAYAMPAADRPTEIVDCAALLRFAYREALRAHDGAWTSSFAFDDLPSVGGIEKYNYPFTPLGASLFRIGDGTFAQFADAQTLRRHNTHFIGRDVQAAEQGDLLFYRQANPRMPDHAMIVLTDSLRNSGGPWAVYHTGPSDNDSGEIRRPTIANLLNHPEPQWRPNAANANFLGVYRWNILR